MKALRRSENKTRTKDTTNLNEDYRSTSSAAEDDDARGKKKKPCCAFGVSPSKRMRRQEDDVVRNDSHDTVVGEFCSWRSDTTDADGDTGRGQASFTRKLTQPHHIDRMTKQKTMTHSYAHKRTENAKNVSIRLIFTHSSLHSLG